MLKKTMTKDIIASGFLKPMAKRASMEIVTIAPIKLL
jgi:hypothetical protein